MKIKCIAIDDEPFALGIIEEYIKKVPFLELLDTFDNAIESIDFIKNNEVDLLFLDIQMEELTGIQLLQILNPRPLVIFTTAYDSYALKGYELDVIDYLLKPISIKRFMKAVDKAYDFVQLKKGKEPAPQQARQSTNEMDTHYFFVKTEHRLEKIEFNDILCIEGQGDYLKIICKNKNIMTLQNFKLMEASLPAENFIRVHKSYMLALNKIESIERNRVKIGEYLIPISDTYKKTFYDTLERRRMIK